jgi:hypothetical protein
MSGMSPVLSKMFCRCGFEHRHVDVLEIFKMADFLLNSLKMHTQFMTLKL